MIARAEYGTMLRSFGLAISVHVLMVLLMVLGTMHWKPFRQPQPVGLAIEAVIVDTGAIRKQREKAEKAAAEALKRKQAQERRDRELEQQKQKDLEAEKRKAEEAVQRKQEAQDKLAALRLEKERKEKAEQAKQQKELEKLRQQSREAEKKRQEEAAQLKQIEARKQTAVAEQHRKAEEADRQKQADAAAAQKGRAAQLSDKYQAAIRELVTQSWLRPPTARAGLNCTLKIVQIPGGEVISAAISGSCNGDEATRRSIIDAVERASPLPYRGFEDAFEREINFIFIYDGD